MKKLFKYQLFIMATIVLVGCSNDDDNTPTIVNEEEVITTLIAVFTPSAGGGAVTFQSQDLDGDGPNAPVVTASGDLAANATYNVAVRMLNETVNPPENITQEVEAEADEHQVFFLPGTGLNMTLVYSNFDSEGNPLGTQMEATTGDAGSGNLLVVLRHEPKKPNDGTLADAGGETDISVSFPVTIQ